MIVSPSMFSGVPGGLRPIDAYFADCMVKLAGCKSSELWLGAALASNKTGEGHSCVGLFDFADRQVFSHEQWEGLKAPSLQQWLKVLRKSAVVVSPGGHAPLVLDKDDRLYLQRYWAFESNIAQQINTKLRQPLSINTEKLKAGLSRLFPGNSGATDWQQVAAAVSVLKRFSVISGGPGTGKTSTVTKIIALLIEQSYPRTPCIALSAPTGKAAVRLCEAVKNAKCELLCEQAIAESIPDQAQTLHRLLKAIPGRVGFRHNADYPLILDALIVDEASMVDLPLMSRLLDALPAHTQLILLGDRDQLASVEPGNVFGDICAAKTTVNYSQAMQQQLFPLVGSIPKIGNPKITPHISDSITVLDKSYRFSDQSGIGHLSKAVNQGNSARCRSLFDDRQYSDIQWLTVRDKQLPAKIAQCVIEPYQVFLQQNDPEKAVQLFSRFRVLCSLRHGPAGTIQLNEAIEQALKNAGLIKPNERWYKGRPVMVTRNDYQLNLFNGDIGVVLPDRENLGRMRAFFLAADRSIRTIQLERLPEHETAFAMTIHKSQGSEFDRVICVLPDDIAPVLSRELIYTAITRAKHNIAVWGTWSVFAASIARVNRRYSGLRDKLWGNRVGCG